MMILLLPLKGSACMENKLSQAPRASTKASGLFVKDNIPISSPLTINTDNPLSDGLYFFATCHNGDFINHAAERLAYDAAPTSVGAYQDGKYLRTCENSDADFVSYENRNLKLFANNEITFCLRARLINNNPSNFNYYFCTGDSNLGDHQLNYYNIDNQVRANPSAGESQLASSEINGYVFNDISFTFSRGDGFFILNQIYDEGTWLVGPSPTINEPDTPLSIGNRANTNRPFDGEIEYVALWNKSFTRDALINFQKNPYQVLKPA